MILMRRQAMRQAWGGYAVTLYPRKPVLCHVLCALHDGDLFTLGTIRYRCDLPSPVAPPDQRGRKRPPRGQRRPWIHVVVVRKSDSLKV